MSTATRATRSRSRRWSSSVVADHGGLDIFFANAGVSGGFDGDFRQDAGRLGGNPAHQPDRPVPRDQICRAGDEGSAAAGRSSATASVAGLRVGRGRPGLFGVEGGGHQPGQGRRDATGRRQHPRQRDLPRPDRDRHDRIHLRPRPRQGPGGPDRPSQSAEARRRADRNRQRGAVPRLRRGQLRQRPGDRRRRRPQRLAPLQPPKLRTDGAY